jgi:hypothetical protein
MGPAESVDVTDSHLDQSYAWKQTLLLKNGVFGDVTPCGSCKNHVSEELSASFIRVTRICELGTTLASEEWCLLGCYAVWLL